LTIDEEEEEKRAFVAGRRDNLRGEYRGVGRAGPGHKAMGIGGIVFDLDGVLMDSTPCHRAAFEQVFQSLGIQEFDYSRHAGWRTEDVIREVLAQAGRSASEELVAAASQEKRSLARQAMLKAGVASPSCRPVLERLAEKHRLGLASSGSRQSVDFFLQQSGLRELFLTVLSCEDVRHAKPAPEMYEKTFEALGLSPWQCLVVEDAAAGVLAGKMAGATVTGLKGTCSEDELIGAGADAVLGSLEELPAWIEERPPQVLGGIIEVRGWERYAAPQVLPGLWTALIAAAGRGTRLGFDKPKILYPVAGKTILERLLELLLPFCEAVVLVVSPSGRQQVEEAASHLAPGRIRLAVQDEPTGMGDAVAIGLEAVRTLHTAVVWGDQVALRRQSVEACLRLHQGWMAPAATCPTVMRSNPYIHFIRDAGGEVRGVLQAREGEAMPSEGESDTGFFCFRTGELRGLAADPRYRPLARGGKTAETNLLPLLPIAAEQTGRVIWPRLMCVEETVGINGPQDAEAVEEFIRRSCVRQ